MTAALLAFLHHLSAFVVFAALMVELVLIKAQLTTASARAVLRMDAVYGAAATVLLIVGFVRVFYTEKGAFYYFHSAAFIAKITLFAIVGLLSIYPTVQFMGWRRTLKAQQTPVLEEARRRTIRMVIHAELTLLAIIMLCAALMARGLGY
jgi:putative membrane protein